jgi:8-amino-7-oxononanoate synthase
MVLEEYLSKRISKQKEEGLYRQLKTESPAIDFCSNDYLGLSRSGELHKLISEKYDRLKPTRNGATGSRLLSGNAAYTEEVEHKLSNILRSEATLIFNSGYSANQAVLSSIPQRGDTILYDELAHACIKDGARLSLATRYSFRHNDLNDLESKLQKATGRTYIVIESIYSMDGDESPLLEIAQLSEKYNAAIILDEAHSTGVVGESGNGLANLLSLKNRIHIRIYTFGKAMGVHGACVAGSKNLIDYLINFARPFIYTTALSPHSICAIDCAFEFLANNTILQNTLKEKIALYRSKTLSIENKTVSRSAIQTFIFSGNSKIKNAASSLQNKGFDVRPILSPTVPKDSERLRICLHTYNTNDEIAALTNLLSHLI